MRPQTVQVNLVLLPTGSDADRQRAGPLTILLPQTHIALEYQTDLNVCPMKNVLSLDDFLLFREIVLAFLHHSLEAVQQQVHHVEPHAQRSPRAELQAAILLDQERVMFDQQP